MGRFLKMERVVSNRKAILVLSEGKDLGSIFSHYAHSYFSSSVNIVDSYTSLDTIKKLNNQNFDYIIAEQKCLKEKGVLNFLSNLSHTGNNNKTPIVFLQQEADDTLTTLKSNVNVAHHPIDFSNLMELIGAELKLKSTDQYLSATCFEVFIDTTKNIYKKLSNSLVQVGPPEAKPMNSDFIGAINILFEVEATGYRSEFVMSFEAETLSHLYNALGSEPGNLTPKILARALLGMVHRRATKRFAHGEIKLKSKVYIEPHSNLSISFIQRKAVFMPLIMKHGKIYIYTL